MLRKTIVAAAILVASSSVAFAAHAHPSYKGEAMYKGEVPCPKNTPNSGFYLGAEMGATSSYYSFNDFAANDPMNMGRTAFSGGLFAGYGYLFPNRLYLAGEIFGKDNGYQKAANATDDSSIGVNMWVQNKMSYGFSILPGVAMNDSTIGYLRFGVVRTNFVSHVDASGSTAPVGLPAATSSNNQTGCQLGLGAKMSVAQNWDVRAEYDHVFYKSFTTPQFIASQAYNIQPQSDEFNLGVAYSFG